MGARPNPLDEEKVLALLREGRSPMSVSKAFHVGHRRIRALAVANGIRFRRKRTRKEIKAQDSEIRRLRAEGLSWTKVAEALGYENVESGRVAVRQRALASGFRDAVSYDAWRTRSVFRQLRKANDGRADWFDLESFVRMAGNPRMHWLLRPAEIELARKYRLLPAADMDTPANELIDRSLHTPPATPTPRTTWQ